jgi:hypothetical protein
VQFRLSGSTSNVLGPLVGVTNGAFVVPLAGNQASNGFHRILLTAQDGSGHRATNFVDVHPVSAAQPANWASFYPFTTGAGDASNHYNGTLVGATVQNDPTRGNVANLSGSSQYVNLPTGVGSLRTFSGWAKWNGGAAWQRILDFGIDTSHWLYLTPRNGEDRFECGITADGANYVHLIQAAGTFPVSTWIHLAVVLDGRQGILYSNGQAIAVNNSVNLLPSDIGVTRAWLGRSQFPVDAYFSGRLDSIRLNSRALSPAELLAPSAAITAPSAGALFAGGDTISYAGAATDYTDAPLPASAFTWWAEFGHDGLTDTVLGPLNGVTAGTLAVPTTGNTSTNVLYRIRLQVSDTNGNQQLVTTEVRPRISQLDLATVPAGLQVFLDGQTLTAPATVAAVAGMSRNVSAPEVQSIAGSNYTFVLWSDGGAASHSITVPGSNTNFTASYVLPAIDLSIAGTNLQLSWPSWAGGLQLALATNLAPPVQWMPITNGRATTNGVTTMTIPAGARDSFYRLQSP